MPCNMLAGVGETMQYAVHDYNDNTIRFILRYPGAVDAAILCQAVKAVVLSVDILHATFKPGKLRGWWWVNQDVPEDSYFAYVQSEDDLMAAAIACAVQPVQPGGQCQLHCSLVQGKEECAVVVNISHLCVDGSDGKYLLGKIAQAYELIRTTGSAEGLAVKNGSRAVEQVYEQLTRREMRHLLHSPLGGVKTAFPYPTQELGEPRMTLRMIPADTMAAARSRAKAAGATANDLLLAACYQSFARLAGLVGMPLVHGAVKTLPLAVLLKCVGRLYGGFSIGLTNLGSIPCDELALGGLAPVVGAFGGPLKKKPAMQVSAASFHGACSLCVAGQYTQQDAEKLQTLLNGMAEEIAQYAAKP